MGKQKDKEQEISKLNLFETAIDALPYPFYVIDPKTYRIVLANNSSSSYIGKTCFEATHKRTSPCEGLDHPCGLNRVINDKESFVTEHIHYDEEGNPRNIEIHMHPVFDEEDEVSRVIEYCHDITERRKREKEQDRMSMELYAIYENVPFFLCVVDENRQVVHANQFLSNLTGISQDELFGESGGTAFGCIQKDSNLKQCGFGEECETCALHIAIEDTFETGNSRRDIEKSITIQKDGKEKSIILYGSTSLIQRYGNDRLLICLQDITEQRENERRLEVLSSAVSQSPVTVVITDTRGVIEYTNPKFTETTGYTAQEALGQRTNILKGPNKTKEQYRDLWETILSGNNWKGTFNNRRKDGSLYWESAVISPVKDKNGTILNFFAVKEDITERKKMEEQLRLQARAIEDSTSAVVIADGTKPNHPIIYINPAFEKTTGYGSHEVLGRNCRFLQGKDRDQPGLDTIRKALREGKACQALLRNYRKDGKIFWNDLKITPLFDKDGNVSHFVGISDDVTMLKQVQGKLLLNEKRLRLSQEYAHIGTWDWNIQTGKLSWSDIVPVLLGIPEERMGTTIDDWISLIHPEDQAQVESRIQESIDNDRDFHVEHRYIHTDGSIHWLQEDGNITRTDEGTPLHMLGVVQDITGRKRQEEEIIQSREEAYRANKAKSEFLSAMSHELRTPMNAIMGFGQLLEFDQNINDEQRDNVKEIRKAAGHLLDLINDILDLSRIETGRVEISLESITYDSLLEECFTLLSPLAARKNITFLPEYQPGVYLLADRLRLKQVLVNLLTNAVKYNHPEGYIKVWCSQNSNMVRIAVEDNGRGIPAEQMEHLFEPFNRLGNERKEIEGTGIGLTISKNLVELMDGSIGVKSEEGLGSTFWIDIPPSNPPEEQENETATGSKSDTEDSERRTSKILYIEDNPSNLRLVEQILRKHDNISLFTAHTPTIGLELAEAHQPELVLLDLNLPEMDGFTVLKKMRSTEWGADIPVIAVSANAMTGDAERGRAAGFDEYLTKPLDVKEFLEVIYRFLNMKLKEEQ